MIINNTTTVVNKEGAVDEPFKFYICQFNFYEHIE